MQHPFCPVTLRDHGKSKGLLAPTLVKVRVQLSAIPNANRQDLCAEFFRLVLGSSLRKYGLKVDKARDCLVDLQMA